MTISFPENPTTGQELLGDNGITYNWTGSYWSNAVPTSAGTAFYTAVGGNAFTNFNVLPTNEIDGGNANNTNP